MKCNSKCTAIQHEAWFFRPCTPSASGALECPGSPGAEAASLEKAATQTANKTWLNTDLCLDRETLPTAHHKSINSTQRHKGKTTSILLHNKAEKETWQKSHLSLSFAFKSCFAVWWKVPNCITVIRHCQGCTNSWNAKYHSHQHQLCRL